MLKPTQPRLSQLASAVAVVLGGISVLPAAHAAAPAAGVNISNIASASYVDAAGRSQTVTSNEVKTTVLQVASFTLIADRTTSSNPNGQVSLSHTLTNTGNSTDTFTINAGNVAGDNFEFATIAVYADANGDGVADNTTNLNGSTVTLAPGEALNLIVVTTTPTTATNGQAGQLSITATSVFDPTASTSNNPATGRPYNVNLDTVNVTGNAIIQVTKSASVSAVQVGDTIQYTLTYKNTGNTAATNVVLEDMLPANVAYVAGSAVWSASATALTDTNAADDGYDFNVTTAGAVTFTIPSVAPNTTGTLKFSVQVNASAPAGAINNTATFNYDPDGAGPVAQTTDEPTNQNTVTVAATYLGAINDSSTNNYNDAEGLADADAATDDLISVNISQGQVATFDTYVWNRSNATEAFNLTANKAGLPAGSIVEFFKADGVTPLTDTNGDPSLDTGPLAVGANVKVVVKVTLPASYTGAVSPDNLDTIITATPVNNAAAPDTITLRIAEVTPATVDLTNGAASPTPADGDGPYVPGTIVDSLTVEAGTPASFPIAITNDGATPDNYNLSATVPTGWTVVFYTSDAAGNCSTTQVTNSGAVASGTTAYFCAVVTPPAEEVAGTSDVVFTVTSPVTGLSDSMKDQVTVDENRSLSFTADRTGQVAPGGTVVYSHTLTNTGNSTEGDASGELPISITDTLAGTNTSVYVDLNNNGIAESNELVTNGDLFDVLQGSAGGAGLQPGESVTILVKVEAPAGATAGQQNTTTITVTPTGDINGEVAPAPVSVVDQTTINDGQVRLNKEQALDATCDGIADTTFGISTISAKPGECVVYRITATNDGNASVTSVIINDAVPAFTTLSAAPAPSNDGTSGTVSSSATSVSNNVGTLAPAATARLVFGVQVNQ